MTLLRYFFTSLFLLAISTVSAQIQGTVVSIADGDSFTLLVNQEKVRIRLHGIDCPENGQDHAQIAKNYLSTLILNKVVTVNKIKTDRYQRMVGIVFVNFTNVNEKLLIEGLAWHATAYDTNKKWALLQATARKKKVGLWKTNNPTPPWEYRKKKR
jgi:micrococcal nuclease